MGNRRKLREASEMPFDKNSMGEREGERERERDLGIVVRHERKKIVNAQCPCKQEKNVYNKESFHKNRKVGSSPFN
ncbi:conserved hypothetical protein [Ricinus communis]|uniref:Uncharacterized protein n=1 Tax=Ricinus communis TaxID=3988 RepID=B9RIX7_RICCO|nr:conserved hypothetical protein [Ricinus communis]